MSPSSSASHSVNGAIEISVVIPVYNGADSIASVVARVQQTFVGRSLEIVLVDDGSHDNSAAVCAQLCGQGVTTFVRLSRNFGEHNAVLAGLAQTRGAMIAVLDDDAQNPPEELPRLFDELVRQNLDVVYGRYVQRKHSWSRQLGSWFNDRMANIMLGKPRDLYLSSFKVMNRFIVDQILAYRGPYPYIDGLICRVSRRLGQLPVQHAPRAAGRSNYTLTRLIRLWLNMFMGFSILPLRVTSLLGLTISATSVLWLLLILIDKLWFTPHVTTGIPTVLACLVLFSGVQLMVMGMIGEYVGRMFLSSNGQPQYVVRDVMHARAAQTAGNMQVSSSAQANQPATQPVTQQPSEQRA
ncbi:MAG: glycosyltransferase [Pirellulaceae bacterium]|nr:glycosyltransferase [Pirellulaceae bacterium]